jgi:hypothetical protein
MTSVTECGVKLTTKQNTKAPRTNPLSPPFVSRSTLFTAVPTSQLCPGFQSHCFSSGFPSKIFYVFVTPSMPSTSSFYLIFLDLSIWIISCENSSLCNCLHSHATLSISLSNIILSTQISKIVSLCAFINVTNKISHSNKISSTFKYLIFMVLNSRREERTFWTESSNNNPRI